MRLSAYRCLLDSIPERKEGSGACGARVLSFVRFAPNDGFRPGTAPPSGLVQRKCCMPPLAVSLPMAAKTKQPRLRHRSGDLLESPFMCRLRTNFARLGDPLQGLHMGNAPLLSPVATSPPEGEILATLYFELLMRVKVERRVNFPLRGKWCAAPKGVHFRRPQGGCLVLPRSGIIKLIAAKRRYLPL